METIMEDGLLTVADLADYLAVPPAWLRDNYTRLGLPSLRVGPVRRFRKIDVDGWIAQQAKQH
jgi:excisionase family DNA binding protein